MNECSYCYLLSEGIKITIQRTFHAVNYKVG